MVAMAENTIALESLLHLAARFSAEKKSRGDRAGRAMLRVAVLAVAFCAESASVSAAASAYASFDATHNGGWYHKERLTKPACASLSHARRQPPATCHSSCIGSYVCCHRARAGQRGSRTS
jgi:hypothetical protein